MGDIKQWIVGISLAAGGCALIELLKPKGAMRKSMTTVTAIFFLCALVFPLGKVLQSGNNLSFESFVPNVSISDELSLQITQQSCNAAQDSIKNLIQTVLLKNGIIAQKITVRVSVDRDGVFQIDQVMAVLSKQQYLESDKIKELIRRELGILMECVQGGA